MKALCHRDGLASALAMVSGVVPTRSPKATLQNVKLIASESSGSTLFATDLEVSIRHRVLGVKIDQPGSVILPTQHFQQILRTSTDDELAIEVAGDHLVVRGQRSQFKLPTEDPDAYPDVLDFQAESYFVVSSADLRAGIRRTAFATDVESTRYALGGVLFELGSDSLTLVGTDGRRLARQVMSMELEGGAKAPASQPVVPVKALKLLERNLKDDDPPVHLTFAGNNMVLIRTNDAVISSKLVEGRFPRYQDVLPGHVETRIPIEVGGLLHAVEQASIVTSDESRGVEFHFGPGMLKLMTSAPDQGSSDVELPLVYDGKAVRITFDPRYLADALRTLDEGATITAELVDSKNAAVFKTEDRYTYVVMPLTRER